MKPFFIQVTMLGFLFWVSACVPSLKNGKAQETVSISEEQLQIILATKAPEIYPQNSAIEYFSKRLAERDNSDMLALNGLVENYRARFAAYNQKEDLDKALQYLEELRKKYPSHAGVNAYSISMMMDRHEFKAALEYANTHKLEATSRFDVLFAAGQEAEAERILQDTLHLKDSHSFGVLTRKARLLDRKGDLDSATILLRKARELANAYAQPPMVRAWCLVELAHLRHHAGDAKEAVSLYLEALSIQPGDPHAVEGLGWIAYGIDEDLDKAENLFKHSLSLGGHADLILALSDIAKLQGDEEKATSLRADFLKTAGEDSQNQRWYALSIARTLAENRETITKAVQIAEAEVTQRQSQEALATLAYCLSRQEETTPEIIVRAKELALRSVAYGKAEPKTMFLAGVVLRDSDQKMAQELLSQVAESKKEVGIALAEQAKAMM